MFWLSICCHKRELGPNAWKSGEPAGCSSVIAFKCQRTAKCGFTLLTNFLSAPEWTSIPNKPPYEPAGSDHHQSLSWFQELQPLLLAMRCQIFQRAYKRSISGSSLRTLPPSGPGRPTISCLIQSTPLCERSIATRPQLSLRPTRQSQAQSSSLRHNSPSSWHRPSIASRLFSASRSLAESQHGGKEQSYKEEMKGKTVDPDENDGEEHEFARSEKAAQASQLNLSARLSKEGTHGGT